MPVLVLAPPSHAAEVRPFLETDETAIAQGLEGQQVREQIESVSRHWRQQSLDAMGQSADDLLDELNNYQHVPFEFGGTRRVRYVRVNELKPRTIDFGEDEE